MNLGDFDIQALSLCLSIINLVGFLISLILIIRQVKLLSDQIKQTERNISGSTYESSIEQARYINSFFVLYPELTDIWGSIEYLGIKNNECQMDEVRKKWIITMIFDFYENLYFQYKQGNVPEEMWNRWEKHIINVFKNGHIHDQWINAKKVYYEPFVHFIDDNLNNI